MDENDEIKCEEVIEWERFCEIIEDLKRDSGDLRKIREIDRQLAELKLLSGDVGYLTICGLVKSLVKEPDGIDSVLELFKDAIAVDSTHFDEKMSEGDEEAELQLDYPDGIKAKLPWQTAVSCLLHEQQLAIKAFPYPAYRAPDVPCIFPMINPIYGELFDDLLACVVDKPQDGGFWHMMQGWMEETTSLAGNKSLNINPRHVSDFDTLITAAKSAASLSA